MNDNKKFYNLKEVENKLHNFQEGKDYFVTPSREPEIKDYTFYNDRLKSLFGGNNWVPVRVWQEKFDGKDVRYRGHFEEGKDYRYSAQHWNYEKDYQGDRGIENMPDWMRSVFVDAEGYISSHSQVEVRGEAGNFKTGEKFWEKRWVYEGKGRVTESLGPVEKRNPEPKAVGSGGENWEVENHRANLAKFQGDKWQIERDIKEMEQNGSVEAKQKAVYLRSRLVEVKEKICYHEQWLAKNTQPKEILPAMPCATCDKRIESNQGHYICKEHKEHHCSKECAEKWYKCHMEWVSGDKKVETKKPAKSDLEKENQELRQQLAQVQAELAQVLTELKKLTGKGNKELEQQQAENEKAIKQGSVAEIKAQMQKSQALMSEAGTQTKGTAPEKSKPGNGVLPYVAVGSLLVAVGLGGMVFWWKKHSSKK